MAASTRLLWALFGWIGAFVATILVLIPVFAAGWDPDDDLSIPRLVLLQSPLWLGLIGTPLLARRYGLDWRSQIRCRMRGRDIGIGAVTGIALQVAVVLLYQPIFWVFGDLDLEGPARELTDLAVSGTDVALLVLMTVVVAPVTEEIFFRGLLQGAIEDRLGRLWAVVLASTTFALTHFQVEQFPALVLVGVVTGMLVMRSGRLGPALWSHAAFNAVTVVVLVLR